MNYGKLKSQIQTLGFEEAATMNDSEYLNIIINGINRAMEMISQEVAPVISEIDFVVGDETTVRSGLAEYALNDIPNYEELFIGVEDVIYKTDTSILFDVDWMENGDTLYVPDKRDGAYTVRYRRKPAEITLDTEDGERIDMPTGVTNLIAPLAAYYIWLDDDIQKAQMYRNDYEQLKDTYLGNRSSFVQERVYSIE